MPVFHLKTVIQTILVEVDDNGNTIQEYLVQADQNKPDPLLIRSLDEECFLRALDALRGIKSQLEKNPPPS